jgi:hypothetical protein
MATNYNSPSREYPTRNDVERMEREDRKRAREYNSSEDKIENYLRNHPDASWAEANYKIRARGQE